jgi:hypothetical protein
MRRREFITLLGGAVAWPITVRAQQPPKTARIGFLGAASPVAYSERVQALQAGLRDLGYLEGKNMVFESRWANGDYAKLPLLAGEPFRRWFSAALTRLSNETGCPLLAQSRHRFAWPQCQLWR